MTVTCPAQPCCISSGRFPRIPSSPMPQSLGQYLVMVKYTHATATQLIKLCVARYKAIRPSCRRRAQRATMLLLLLVRQKDAGCGVRACSRQRGMMRHAWQTLKLRTWQQIVTARLHSASVRGGRVGHLAVPGAHNPVAPGARTRAEPRTATARRGHPFMRAIGHWSCCGTRLCHYNHRACCLRATAEMTARLLR